MVAPSLMTQFPNAAWVVEIAEVRQLQQVLKMFNGLTTSVSMRIKYNKENPTESIVNFQNVDASQSALIVGDLVCNVARREGTDLDAMWEESPAGGDAACTVKWFTPSELESMLSLARDHSNVWLVMDKDMTDQMKVYIASQTEEVDIDIGLHANESQPGKIPDTSFDWEVSLTCVDRVKKMFDILKKMSVTGVQLSIRKGPSGNHFVVLKADTPSAGGTNLQLMIQGRTSSRNSSGEGYTFQSEARAVDDESRMLAKGADDSEEVITVRAGLSFMDHFMKNSHVPVVNIKMSDTKGLFVLRADLGDAGVTQSAIRLVVACLADEV